jgi:hypothetical protein
MESAHVEINALPLQEFIGDVLPVRRGERRQRTRFPIASSLRFIPLDGDGNRLDGRSHTITGKDLSVRGMSFLHEFPMEYCRAVVTYTQPDIGTLSVEVQITWTRQTPIGLFETGCLFVRKCEGHNIRLESF